MVATSNSSESIDWQTSRRSRGVQNNKGCSDSTFWNRTSGSGIGGMSIFNILTFLFFFVFKKPNTFCWPPLKHECGRIFSKAHHFTVMHTDCMHPLDVSVCRNLCKHSDLHCPLQCAFNSAAPQIIWISIGLHVFAFCKENMFFLFWIRRAYTFSWMFLFPSCHGILIPWVGFKGNPCFKHCVSFVFFHKVNG